jgi:hypothetical protein
MLKIENINKIVGLEYGRYKIHSVKDFSESYSFAVLDTDDMRYFRIDLMKNKIKGDWQLRWAPSKYFNISNASIWDKDVLIQDMVELIVKHRKPIKAKC